MTCLSGARFANLYVSTLDTSALPIRLDSFIPYRAHVASAQGGTLESFRVYMPGYHASIDGVDSPVSETKEHLVAVRVPSGSHDVEIRFVGTAKLWVAAAVSAAGWTGLLLCFALGSLRRRHQGTA